jgi:hypothetical protein
MDTHKPPVSQTTRIPTQRSMVTRRRQRLARFLATAVFFPVFWAFFNVPMAEARCWRCSAHIVLMGSSGRFQRSWEMCTGGEHVAPNDREKSCKHYIKAEFLGPKLWNSFHLSRQRENEVCKTGSAKFKIQYEINKRPGKWWYFEPSIVAPPCNCASSCQTGYSLDNTSWPGSPRCVKLLCSGCADGIPNERCGPHEEGIGIWNGNVYHHRRVKPGKCQFD